MLSLPRALSPTSPSSLRRRGVGDPDSHCLRVYGRGGPQDWSPPPLPRCADYIPERLEVGREQARRRRLKLLQEEADHLNLHGLGGDLESFRAYLGHKFGNPARGWRKAFAPDSLGTGLVTFGHFCRAMKSLGHNGQAMSVWKALQESEAPVPTISSSANNNNNNNNSSSSSTTTMTTAHHDIHSISISTDGEDALPAAVGLEHLEPDLGKQLDVLSKKWADKFKKKGTTEAWKAIERHHMARANFTEIQRFFTERRLLPRFANIELRRVFDLMDSEGSGTVTKKDLTLLDRWAHRRHGIKMPEEERDLSPEAKARERRLSDHWIPLPLEPKQEPGLEEFRQFLKTKYPSPAHAWRVLLDLRGMGAISPSELGHGCRSIGWKHDHRALFKELSAQCGGLATLRGLDPDTGAAIDVLSTAISDRYGGDMHQFWTQTLDPDDSGLVSRREFVEEVADAIGISRKQAVLIWAVLDTAKTGYLAEAELAFIEAFESQLGNIRRAQRQKQKVSGTLLLSMSAPSLYATSGSGSGNNNNSMNGGGLGGPGNGNSNSNSFNNNSSSFLSNGSSLNNNNNNHNTSVSSMTSSRGLEGPLNLSQYSTSTRLEKAHIASPSRSSRAAQTRALATVHKLKHMFIEQVLYDHCRSRTLPMVNELRSTQRAAIRSTPQGDIFRHTSQFYREGVKRLQMLQQGDDSEYSDSESYED